MTYVYVSGRTKPLYRATQVVNYLLGLLELLLAFRLILRLLGANPGAGFTNFIYTLSRPFVSPFINVFRVTQVEGRVFEWTTLLAMFVYWILAEIIIRIFVMSKPVSTPMAAAKLDEEDE